MGLVPAGYKRILVPLDGSGFAEVALPHAQAIAERTGATLLLLRVVEPLAQTLPPEVRYALDVERLDEHRMQEAEVYLRARTGELAAEGLKVEPQVVMGTPVADRILDVISSEGVDLVVMSTHGTSGITQWFAGSVARKVVLAAPVPVLLIRVQAQ